MLCVVLGATLYGFGSLGEVRAADVWKTLSFALLWLVVLLSGLYHVLFVAAAGATPGQALFGLRVIDERRGEPPGLARSLSRWANGPMPRSCAKALHAPTSLPSLTRQSICTPGWPSTN